jgi:hypothetical protein
VTIWRSGRSGGIDAPEDLAWRLDPSWERTSDPYALEGVGTAVEVVHKAVAEGRWHAACRTWDELLVEYPRDALALQWSQLWDFYRGDAVSLRGKGEMDFQSAIKLTFHAIVGRGELNLPIIKQVFSGASQQIMLIHVDGTLQNPETRKEAFPGVSQALQQLQGELQK